MFPGPERLSCGDLDGMVAASYSYEEIGRVRGWAHTEITRLAAGPRSLREGRRPAA